MAAVAGGLTGFDSLRTRGSATLWKLFIAFEVRAGQLERAKKLLFRAVGECPLVKGALFECACVKDG